MNPEIIVVNKVGKFAELTIDMEETAYKAFTGIRAIDHSIFEKHLEDRFENIPSPNFEPNAMKLNERLGPFLSSKVFEEYLG